MANNSGYSSTEIMTMQKDAMRRVNEMQRIAREKIEGTIAPAVTSAIPNKPIKNVTNQPPSRQIPNTDTITQQKPQNVSMEIVHDGFTGILEKLNLDDEKLILILLIILLVNEGADIILILALGYILL